MMKKRVSLVLAIVMATGCAFIDVFFKSSQWASSFRLSGG